MRYIKPIGGVFAVFLALLVFRQPLVNYAHDIVSSLERHLHRRVYAIGDIKSALSQSCRVSVAVANYWEGDRSQIQQAIRDLLWDDSAIVAVEVRDVNGNVVADVDFKNKTNVFQTTVLSNLTDMPILLARDGKRVDVQRVICVSSNVVGVLNMQRQTMEQLNSNDIANFQRCGDGGLRGATR
jgi:hypothetical protein